MRIPVVCLALIVCVTAAQARPLSLVEAVETAMANRPTLVRAKLSVQSAKDRVTQSNSAYLPDVSAGGQYQYQRTRTDTTGGSAVGIADQTNANIQASIRLFDLGQRNWTASSSRRGYESALEGFRDAQQQTILSVSQAYMNAYLTKQIYEVRALQLERTLKESEQIRAQVAVGASANKNLLQAEASAANAQVALLQADTNAQTAITDLAVAMGLDAKQAWELSLPALFYDPQDNSPEAQLKAALANRPDIRMGRLSEEMSRLSYRINATNAGVTVNGDATASYRFSPDDSDNSSVMVTASIPVFDAGYSKAAKNSAKNSYLSSQQTLRDLELQVRAEVENMRLEQKNSELRLAAALAAVKVSKSNYDSAQESMTEGVGTIVEVLTARAAYTDAQVNLAQAQSDSTMSMIRLRIALGEDDVVTSNK